MASSELRREAFAAGFSMGDIQEAEEELHTPTQTAVQELKQGSVSKKLIDTWTMNRRDKVKPWQGPLPPPRVSPPRTLGDALAAASVQVRPSQRTITRMKAPGSCSPASQKQKAPVPMITQSDPKLKSPAITGIPNSYSNSVSKGRHANHMGRPGYELNTKIPYKPTQGLVSLFARTGKPRLSKNTKPPQPRRTYAEVLRSGMENGRAPARHTNGGSLRGGAASGGAKGYGQAGALARGGGPNLGFNPGYGGRGFQGNRGGGRPYERRGRGYGGHNQFHREGNGAHAVGSFGQQDKRQGAIDGRADQMPKNTQQWRPSGGSQTVPQGPPNAGKGTVNAVDAAEGNQAKDTSEAINKLPAQVAALLQQAIAAMIGQQQKEEGSKQLETHQGEVEKSAAPEESESSAQGAARMNSNNGKLPHCFRCYAKGHEKQDCKTVLYCVNCESTEHVKGRCPLYKIASKVHAIPCGYAVPGLGFYHIPNKASVKAGLDVKAAVIRVSDGVLTTTQVIAELEGLIPGKWKWEVEEVGNNAFKTTFPSKGELQRMIGWGAVQSKFNNAKMVIQERGSKDRAKFTMPKIWLQFTGLPEELRDFLVIWAVGSILGITKDVGMPFTRAHEIARLQVAVLDPDLIPETADVVIGEDVYELQFKVEPEEINANPMPMDMDRTEGDDAAGQGGKEKEEDANRGNKGSQAEGPQKLSSVMKSSEVGSAQGRGGKQHKEYMINTMILPDHVVLTDRAMGMEGLSGGDHVDNEEQEDYEEHLAKIMHKIMHELQEDNPKMQQEILKLIQEGGSLGQKITRETLPAKVVQTSEEKARDLAAVPEADTTSRRSKRRAALADQDSGERAEKLKATRNLDAPCNNDNENTPTPSFLQLSNDDIISNMSDIGMVVGIDKIADSMLIETLKTVEKERWLDIIEQA
jgi:hypothetical protein